MNGEIRLIGIDGEWGYPLHTHDSYEVIHYLEGEGILRSAAGDVPFAAGNIVVIPPNLLHSTEANGDFRAVMLGGVSDPFFGLSAPVLIRDNADREAETLVRMLLRNRLESGEYLTALREAYLHFLVRNIHAEDAITAAVRHIAKELSERFADCSLTPVELLQESGYAEDYIRARFKALLGKTPTEFLTSLRVSHAAYLIELYGRSLTLSEVAEQCGFTDYAYFSKKFKEQRGVSPKGYRRS